MSHKITRWDSIDGALRLRASEMPGKRMLCEYRPNNDGTDLVWSSAGDVDLLARRVGRWLLSRSALGDRVLVCLPAGTSFVSRATAPLPSIVRAGLEKQPRDLELPPWLKGRYGTAVGRAVHGVLQTVPLATGDGLETLAEGQALAEDIPDLSDQVAAAAQAALSSPIIMRAAVRPHWRETYVGTVIDGMLVEGYVDLLFRDDDGLVIVDYKTDTATGPEALAAYETQLSVYARAVSDAAGEPVVRGVLLFLRPGLAREYAVLSGDPV